MKWLKFFYLIWFLFACIVSCESFSLADPNTYILHLSMAPNSAPTMSRIFFDLFTQKKHTHTNTELCRTRLRAPEKNKTSELAKLVECACGGGTTTVSENWNGNNSACFELDVYAMDRVPMCLFFRSMVSIADTVEIPSLSHPLFHRSHYSNEKCAFDFSWSGQLSRIFESGRTPRMHRLTFCVALVRFGPPIGTLFSPNTFCDASFEYSKRFIQFKALMYLCVENNLPVKRVRTCGSRVKRRKSKSVHVNWLHSHGNWPIEALVLAFAHHFSSFDSEQQLH